MTKISISINPLAEYVQASPRRKRTIVRQQIYQPVFKVARYKAARSHIRKSLMNGFSKDIILNGIAILQNRVPRSKFSADDIHNSIEALRAFLTMQFPDKKRYLKCSFSASKINSFEIGDVGIVVAPDLLLRFHEDGKNYLGGIKFRLVKSSKFTLNSAQVVAFGIHSLLKQVIAAEEEVVLPHYCLFVDVFDQRVVSADNLPSSISDLINNACIEILEIAKDIV